MRKVLVVARRELSSYFNSPMAYIVVLFFLVLTSAWLFLGALLRP
jgi:ABC-type transport system involved in multi-copper enzyme maturation permease subunit